MKTPIANNPKSEKKLLLKKVIISKLADRKPILGDDGGQSTNAYCHYTQTAASGALTL
jgi:hypothetical protein